LLEKYGGLDGMADLELNGIDRISAVELFEAVDRANAGESTWIVRGGVRVAKIVPVKEDTRRKGMAARRARPSNQYRYEHYDPR
jgi:hypothetical protein